ncbi:MAG: hypothetical protein IT535_00280 [Bauldia sp.]|nr:hypothetical protein [Bauldia sp.]
MRSSFYGLAALALTSSGAMALELPVAGAYGSEAGCAKAAEAREIPSGTAMAVTPAQIFQGGLFCPYTAVTQGAGDAAAPAWEASVRCTDGEHEDDATLVTYRLTEHVADKLLTVAVVSGNGIEGEFAYCPVQPAP